MKALVFKRSPSKYAITKAVSSLSERFVASASSLSFSDGYSLAPPTPNYLACDVIASGICGSDLGLVGASSSRYFEPLASFPFVPGHEVVAMTSEFPGREGTPLRVVLEPLLGCSARGIAELCRYCAIGNTEMCLNVTAGDLQAGLQTGYCASTGGGWSERFYAHPSQLHLVPEEMSDTEALMVEPYACALHSVLSGAGVEGDKVCVIGSGTVGLLTLAALAATAPASEITALARYSHQAAIATSYGAQIARTTEELRRIARTKVRTMMVGNRITGAFDVTYDCVASPESIETALEVTRPGGTVVLSGMPTSAKIDLSALWHKQITLRGSYAYGTEHHHGASTRTFDLALAEVSKANLGRLVSLVYPLEDYEEAINHARNAGRRGAVKIAFDPRAKSSRSTGKVS